MIDLLRRIFTQTVHPLLTMISEFVTIGSFEDPFSEFFVEKLYKSVQKSAVADEDNNSEVDAVDEGQFVYKLTSDVNKIPVFLTRKDTAITIFKIGCDLNLLKTKR